MYLVTAYRWGELNGHHYYVYAGPDEIKALSLAQVEVQDRGGKYGVAVYKFDATGTEYELIEYYGGLGDKEGALAPMHNTRKDMLMDLGLALEEAATSGKFDQHIHGAGEGKGAYRIRRIKIKVPRWAKLAYARAKRREFFMNKIYNPEEGE